MRPVVSTFIRAALWMVLLAITSGSAWAQLSTAQLNGRVTDESNAVLPGATVTLTQTETGFVRSVVTDGDGAYVAPNLPTGPYQLEVTLEGFRGYTQRGIVLQVASNPTINVVLALGTLEESVTVEGASPLVDVRSAGLSQVVDHERIVELPLQGRDVTALLVISGASVPLAVNPVRTVNGGARIAVAGGQSDAVTYLLDGALHLSPGDNLNLPLPFPDALQEFSIATSGLGAQYGVKAGAAVNAVTKSGTNRFTGSGFEFMRDKRFNATNPFALVGPDGKRLNDGLSRHQFGGTLGGPIVRNKLFFFAGHQGTRVRSEPSSTIAWVPTPAMLAGDFTAFASPACNGGRQITLRAPFVNNRIDPSQMSPAALRLTRLLPSTTDPCGQVTYGIREDQDERQSLVRVDFQWNANRTIFGRYLDTFVNELPVWDPGAADANILTTSRQGRDRTAGARSLTLGDTLVFGGSMVNALRVAYNDTTILSVRKPWVDAPSIGIPTYASFPGKMIIDITGGFLIGHSSGVNTDLRSKSYMVNDDLTIVSGRHQLTVGGSAAYWTFFREQNPTTPGRFTFRGDVTGLGLADFMTGRLFRYEQSDPQVMDLDQMYIGLYAQDAWRVTDRLTLNMGTRWEPYFGQDVNFGSISNFSVERFRAGERSSVYVNAPPGLLFPGDSAFPPGRSGFPTKWWNISPRLGAAWDVNGDGRTAVRTSYSLTYDFPPGDFLFTSAGASPYANRLQIPGALFDDPFRTFPGGNPFPFPLPPPSTAAFPAFGNYGTVDPKINSPRAQQWNVTLEQQIGNQWGFAVSYLGNHSDRMWGSIALNPGTFLGLGPCTLAGVSYAQCTNTNNLNQRRVLFQENPANARLLGNVDQFTDIASQDYHALKVSGQRRAASGIGFTGNYTWSHCMGNVAPLVGVFNLTGRPTYFKPEDPDFDRGHCDQNRTHIVNATVTAETPRFDQTWARFVASNWRVAGIVNARSGNWLTIATVQDVAGTGLVGQRPNLVSDDVYGTKTLNNYLNRAAFALPAPGTYGNLPAASVQGPGFWTVDVALSRLVPVRGQQALEFRIEAFNALNNFNWGDPDTNIDSGQFGRITLNGGFQRIMQFAIKYAF